MLDTRPSPSGAPSNNNKGSNGGLIVFLVIISAVAVVGIGVMAYFKGSGGTVPVANANIPQRTSTYTPTSPVDSSTGYSSNNSTSSQGMNTSQDTSSWQQGTSWSSASASVKPSSSVSSGASSYNGGDPLCYEPSETDNYLNGISALLYKKRLTTDLIEQYHIDKTYYDDVMASSVNGLGMGVPYVAYVHAATFNGTDHTVEATIDSVRYLLRFNVDDKENVIHLEIVRKI